MIEVKRLLATTKLAVVTGTDHNLAMKSVSEARGTSWR
jgi:hypothetical protein